MTTPASPPASWTRCGVTPPPRPIPRPARPPRGGTSPPRSARRARCTCTGHSSPPPQTAASPSGRPPRRSSATARPCPASPDSPASSPCGPRTPQGCTSVLQLTVDRSRLLADFADPDQPGDRRWWEDWDEAVAAGVAGVIPAASLTPPVDAVYVTGLGDGDPAGLFAGLAADGRVGLLAPGLPTNSVDGAPAAALATDAATWWDVLHGAPGDSDRDVSSALTGDPARLGHLPGGDQAHRAPAAALVTALWPALWGFTASQVFDVARGRAPASWAAAALFPEGAYPTVRVGPQPYGLLPVTAWTRWQADDGDPALEAPLIPALLTLRARHAASARARGTAAGKDTDGLLDLIADTPVVATVPLPSGLAARTLVARRGQLRPARRPGGSSPGPWPARYPLASQLGLSPLRRYGTRGTSRRGRAPARAPRLAPDPPTCRACSARSPTPR